MLGAIAGEDPNDPLSSTEPVPDYTASLGSTVAGMKVGVVDSYFGELMVDEVAKAFKEALAALESLGMQVKDVTIPHMDMVPAVQTATSRCENLVAHDPYIRKQPRDYSRELLHRNIASLTIPASTYVTSQRVRRVICREFEEALQDVPVIVAPTVGIAAPTIEECKQGFAEIDGRRIPFRHPSGSIGTRCTIPFNVTGLPALSVCCGFTAAGLPLGLQIIGACFDESRVFQVAHAYEQAARWFERKSPLL